MSRSMPQECKHGRTISWGDFGPEDGSPPPPCPDCEQERTEAAGRFRLMLREEIQSCAGHTHHNGACNCGRTALSILQRMRTDPAMAYAWLAEERDPS